MLLKTNNIKRPSGDDDTVLDLECDKCHTHGMTSESYLGKYKDGYNPKYGWYVRGKHHYCYDCAKKMMGK